MSNSQLTFWWGDERGKRKSPTKVSRAEQEEHSERRPDAIRANEKRDILSALESLKLEKPDGWRKDARKLLKRLAVLGDPYGEHELHGNDTTGRHVHRADCPAYDKMEDDSWP